MIESWKSSVWGLLAIANGLVDGYIRAPFIFSAFLWTCYTISKTLFLMFPRITFTWRDFCHSSLLSNSLQHTHTNVYIRTVTSSPSTNHVYYLLNLNLSLNYHFSVESFGFLVLVWSCDWSVCFQTTNLTAPESSWKWTKTQFLGVFSNLCCLVRLN